MSMWIISPVKDGLFFFASCLVVFAVWAASALGVDPFIILGAVAVVSNGPHLISTWTRVYFDRREWSDRPLALFLAPLVIFGCVLIMVGRETIAIGPLTIDGARLLNSSILYWATWHFVAQNWGLLRIYQRKSGEPEGSLAMKLEKPLLLLFVFYTLLHRLYTGPRMLFGTELYYVMPPERLVTWFPVPLMLLATGYLALRIASRRQPWSRAAWLRTGFLGCAFVGFFVPFTLIRSDDTSAFAAAACWHGFQYLGVMRFYHRTTWRAGVDPKAKVISWLSQPGWGRALLYSGMLLALAGVVYALIFVLAAMSHDSKWGFDTWAVIIWSTLTLSHYWLDGVIWKLRKPQLAQRVGISVAA